MHECNVMQCNSQRQKRKTQKPNNKEHKEKTMKQKDHEKPSQIRDIESHQLLDEESQTYFYQEVW